MNLSRSLKGPYCCPKAIAHYASPSASSYRSTLYFRTTTVSRFQVAQFSRRWAHSSHKQSFLAATVTTSSPDATPIDDLVARLDANIWVKNGAEPRCWIFLVSRGLAHQLGDDEGFIRRSISHLTGGQSVERQFAAALAVVDRISRPIARPNDGEHTIGGSTTRIKHPHTRNDGDEGICILQLEESCVGITTATANSSTSSRPIYIEFNPTPIAASNIPPRHVDSTVHAVEFPSANTLFQLGRERTIFMYESREDCDGIRSLGRTLVEKISIRLQWPRNAAVSGARPATLNVPIYPLTQPAKVVDCMGNIVRRVSDIQASASDPPTERPASSELEQSVSELFQAQGIQPQAIPVWALVLPPDAVGEREGPVALQDYWESNPPKSDPTVPQRIAQGATFRRVLSGGGGYGKKQGLIALDYRFDDSLREFDRFDISGELGSHPNLAGFAEHVKKGSHIQFFTNFIPETAASMQKRDPKVDVRSVEFGTIPNLDNELPLNTDSSNEAEIASFSNHVGILSGQGLGISFCHGALTEEKHNISVDIPYSRLEVCHDTVSPQTDFDSSVLGRSVKQSVEKLPTAFRRVHIKAVETSPMTSQESLQLPSALNLSVRSNPSRPIPGPSQLISRAIPTKLEGNFHRDVQKKHDPAPEEVFGVVRKAFSLRPRSTGRLALENQPRDYSFPSGSSANDGPLPLRIEKQTDMVNHVLGIIGSSSRSR
ncbi:hypothetical protein P152DRAFT_447299 [Eremomyces bilateralis CBS 781.70]|uniref:Uncharacterized protein n=1 Tax=Eremomyces bilateralis CBS 781.70 TaxID=1392243 RepID=A0A6G1GAU7_9PEZI|nr:uncharacterized protein P152DRAFT_447299 [Eremomyces bilateralis CBS 781.70]KAF1815031.1 hypothetical protein P152DRAFT_447299 [Eremomyces bilateralis CBS 781.70]